jgi:6-pyruvoyltetrahydropterin/6-carboxytetrahydropterin synthase
LRQKKECPLTRLTTLHIEKEAHKVSAAHYTIFSATERERLHGHNYFVSARIVATMGNNGFSADYNVYKKRIKALCDRYDEYMLLPEFSPYQTLAHEADEIHATFNGTVLKFRSDETWVLPVANVTVEELSHLLLSELIGLADDPDLVEVELTVSSGSGQAGSAVWRVSE